MQSIINAIADNHMVTSVAENEGKSTLAANLALALAEEQNRVLLLDCDFRQPALHLSLIHICRSA